MEAQENKLDLDSIWWTVGAEPLTVETSEDFSRHRIVRVVVALLVQQLFLKLPTQQPAVDVYMCDDLLGVINAPHLNARIKSQRRILISSSQRCKPKFARVIDKVDESNRRHCKKKRKLILLMREKVLWCKALGMDPKLCMNRSSDRHAVNYVSRKWMKLISSATN